MLDITTVQNLIAQADDLMGYSDDNLADLVVSENEVQNYILESREILEKVLDKLICDVL